MVHTMVHVKGGGEALGLPPPRFLRHPRRRRPFSPACWSASIRELNQTTGLTVLLVEQNAHQALRLAHRV
jgi:hypothetical protein